MFGFEYYIDFQEGDADVTQCHATLNGESCQTCEFRLCEADQEPLVGRFIDCNNVVEGNVNDECAGTYTGVYETEFAVENAGFLSARCPSRVDSLADGTTIVRPTAAPVTPTTPTPQTTSPTFSPTAEKQIPVGSEEYLERCRARRSFLSTVGNAVLGTTCGDCVYNSFFEGYALSCPQTCDECYGENCLRLNNVTSVFNEKTDPVNGNQDAFCKQVATSDSEYYGMEYCVDAGDVLDGFCTSTLEGLPCNSCYFEACPGGSRGTNLDCTNVIPGTFMDFCSDRAGGVLQIELAVLKAAQSGTVSFDANCPSNLEESPPPERPAPSTFTEPIPWHCAPIDQLASDGFSCINVDEPKYLLNPDWPAQFYFECPAAITADPLANCDSSCTIFTFDEDGQVDSLCSECEVLPSGELFYRCANVLPDVDCPVLDRDQNCALWDCSDRTRFIELEENQLQYSCERVGNPGYPLETSVPADTSFFCSEPLGLAEKPNREICQEICAIREVNESVPVLDSRFCEFCRILPNGDVSYDCGNLFPDSECPVKASNGDCLQESQPLAFCHLQRFDGKWLCFDTEDRHRGVDPSANTTTFFACDKKETLFINLEECSSECFIILGEVPDEAVDQISSVTCDSCELLENGDIAFDCRNILPADFECPARDKEGNCYTERSTPPSPTNSTGPVRSSPTITDSAGAPILAVSTGFLVLFLSLTLFGYSF